MQQGNYHCSVKSVSRSQGRSATAAAAYRAGAEIADERTGEIHDYTRKQGVIHAEIVAPKGVEVDRETLWNMAEAAEKRKDAKVAREWELALPHELGQKEQIELAKEFAGKLVEKYGVAVDVCIHEPHREGDQRNTHAHLLATTRAISAEGLTHKTRELDSPKTSGAELDAMRGAWADCCNRAYERAGLNIRTDHRSLKEQGIDREATTHLGPTATQMERRGAESDRGNINREIHAKAAEIENLKAALENVTSELAKLHREKDEVQQEARPFSASQVVQQMQQPKPEPEKKLSTSELMKSFQAKKQEELAKQEQAEKPLSASASIRQQQEAQKAQAEQAREAAKGKDFKDLSLDEQRRIISDLQKAARVRNLDTEIQNSPEHRKLAEQVSTADIRAYQRRDEVNEIRREKEKLGMLQFGKKKELEQREERAKEEAKKAAFDLQLKKEEMEALRQQKTAELSPQIQAHNANAQNALQQLRQLEPIHNERLREAREQERAQNKERGGHER